MMCVTSILLKYSPLCSHLLTDSTDKKYYLIRYAMGKNYNIVFTAIRRLCGLRY